MVESIMNGLERFVELLTPLALMIVAFSVVGVVLIGWIIAASTGHRCKRGVRHGFFMLAWIYAALSLLVFFLTGLAWIYLTMPVITVLLVYLMSYFFTLGCKRKFECVCICPMPEPKPKAAPKPRAAPKPKAEKVEKKVEVAQVEAETPVAMYPKPLRKTSTTSSVISSKSVVSKYDETEVRSALSGLRSAMDENEAL